MERCFSSKVPRPYPWIRITHWIKAGIKTGIKARTIIGNTQPNAEPFDKPKHRQLFLDFNLPITIGPHHQRIYPCPKVYLGRRWGRLWTDSQQPLAFKNPSIVHHQNLVAPVDVNQPHSKSAITRRLDRIRYSPRGSLTHRSMSSPLRWNSVSDGAVPALPSAGKSWPTLMVHEPLAWTSIRCGPETKPVLLRRLTDTPRKPAYGPSVSISWASPTNSPNIETLNPSSPLWVALTATTPSLRSNGPRTRSFPPAWESL